MGEEVKERPLMSVEEFKDYVAKNKSNVVEDLFEKGILHIQSLEGVSKFKSVRRAIKRGNVSLEGVIYPKRPFNNRKNSSRRKDIHSRVINEKKKAIYGQIKQRGL